MRPQGQDLGPASGVHRHVLLAPPLPLQETANESQRSAPGAGLVTERGGVNEGCELERSSVIDLRTSPVWQGRLY